MGEAIVVDYQDKTFGHHARRIIQRFPRLLRSYVVGFFPIFQWIHRYNLSWLLQDIIAGITVGIVVVPQGMAYAKIANLDPQYGLYTSFVGVSIYCFFGTSKDISIGPISMVSLLVGQAVHTITKIQPDITGPEIAVTLSLFAGIITVVISLIRLGILVDFIPGPAIAGYMTGAAITIGVSQWPKLFGIANVSAHQKTYQIIIDFFKNLPQTQLDVAFGLSSIVILYSIKFICGYLNDRVSPRYRKLVYYISIMRNGFVVVLGTLISYLLHRFIHHPLPYSVIETVPAGFDAMQIPALNLTIIEHLGGILPSIVLILILEHVSVGKSFGRIYDYQIDPDQEILAIGISNVIGAFFGAYPATGAFSRSAIMARSGAKTPIAGVFTGAVVVLALYALTPAFYYIPEAILAAVVIHAVSDLLSGPRYIKELLKSKPLEVAVWAAAAVVMVFVDAEVGIYVAAGLSLILLLFRLARHSVVSLVRLPLDPSGEARTKANQALHQPSLPLLHFYYVEESDPNFSHIAEPLPDGILAFRICGSMLYPNANHITEQVTRLVHQRTRFGRDKNSQLHDNDRLWNQSCPSQNDTATMYLPVLRAIVLDMAAVQRMDTTALQALVALRNSLDRYAGQPVEWHFAQVYNRQVRRDLVSYGFGSLPALNDDDSQCCSTNLELDISRTPISDSDTKHVHPDLETGSDSCFTQPEDIYEFSLQDPHSYLPKDFWPCFHWDVDTAVRSIVLRLSPLSDTKTKFPC